MALKIIVTPPGTCSKGGRSSSNRLIIDSVANFDKARELQGKSLQKGLSLLPYTTAVSQFECVVQLSLPTGSTPAGVGTIELGKA